MTESQPAAAAPDSLAQGPAVAEQPAAPATKPARRNKNKQNTVQLVPGSLCRGTVLRLNGTFGFVTVTGSQVNIFFHASDFYAGEAKIDLSLGQKVDLAQHITPGAAVEFELSTGKGGALVAKEVHLLSDAGGPAAPATPPPGAASQAQPAPKAKGPAPQLWVLGTVQKALPSATTSNWRTRSEQDPVGQLLVHPSSTAVLGPLLAAQQRKSAQQAGTADSQHPDQNGADGTPVEQANGSDCTADGREPASQGDAEQALTIPFKRSSMAEQRLAVGDVVRFQICSSKEQVLLAHQIQVVTRAQAPAVEAQAQRLQGFVYSINTVSRRGAIRRADGSGQLPFSLQAVQRDQQAEVTYNAEVEFSVANEGPGRQVASDICLLPPDSIPSEHPLPGRLRGRVMRLPGPGNKGKEKPGAIRCDEGAVGAVVSFSGRDAQAVGAELGDEVTFSRIILCRSGATWAAELQMACKSAHRRELGQIAVLKPHFGFIKCCERRGDLFFHFSALAPGLEAAELSVGDDVDFCACLEPSPQEGQAPRMVAAEVQRVPQGSALFETLEEARQWGAIVDLPMTRGFANLADGVLDYLDVQGARCRLTFGADDVQGSGDEDAKLLAHDRVSFQVATRIKAHQEGLAVGGLAAQHAGRRATHIQQHRFLGTVFSWNTQSGYGFIDVHPSTLQGVEGRLYFNQAEVQSFAPEKGQVVEGIVAHNKRAQPIARHVSQSSQGLPAQAPPPAKEASPLPQRPQRLQKKAPSGDLGVGEAARLKSQPARLCKGPDGTRGFAPGRGRGLPAAAGAPTPAAAPGASKPLQKTPSGLLNPSALAFIPAGGALKAAE